MKLLLSIIGLVSCLCTLAAKPLKVYILVGQSNMQGHAKNTTLEHLTMGKDTQALNNLLTTNGVPKVSKLTHISYAGSHGLKSGPLTVGFGASDDKFGPELALGFTLENELKQPILLIKAAWGGKSLHTDFRPPSAPANTFPANKLEQMKKKGEDVAAATAKLREASGHYYRLSMEHVKSVLKEIEKHSPHYKKEDGYELAGFVWFQGWNDMVNSGVYPNRSQKGGYDMYSELLSTFIKDVRKDLKAPDMPFIIGVMGAGGPTDLYGKSQQRYKSIHQGFRDAMAAPAKNPDLKNVVAVLTEKYWDNKLDSDNQKRKAVLNEIKKKAKEQKLDREARAALEKAELDKVLTAQEQKAIKVGISNAEFHYMGSSKVIAGIGKGFGEALLKK